MARLTIGQKAERVILLLLGLRKTKVAAALVAHGFSDADLEEGFRLLRRVTRARLGVFEQIAAAEPGLVIAIDEWENKWFPIAEAALKRHYPAAHAWLFRNLAQTQGPAVLVSVGTFVERWESLAKTKDKGGPDEGGDEAKKLLVKRGLTKAVIDDAKGLLTRAGKVESAAEAEAKPLDDEDFAKAEADLWAWYLEWSTIAQIAIKDRRLLRELGFLRSKGKGKGGGEGEEGGEEGEGEVGDEENDGAEEAEGAAPAAAPTAKKAPKGEKAPKGG